jgi:RNA-binding protein
MAQLALTSTHPDMTLTPTQRRFLRALAHHKKSVVQIGQAGLTQAVLNEIDQAIRHHELIKIHISAADRNTRDAMIDSICARLGAQLVQRIGNVASLYRAAPDKPKITLPK